MTRAGKKMRRLAWAVVCDVIRIEHKVTAKQLLQNNRGAAPIARARQHAMLILHDTYGFDFTTVGEIMNRDRTTVRHGIERARARAT